MLGSDPSICPLCSEPEARKYQPWRCCSGLLLLLLLLQGSEALQQLLVVMVTVINTPMGLIRDFPLRLLPGQDGVHGYETSKG